MPEQKEEGFMRALADLSLMDLVYMLIVMAVIPVILLYLAGFGKDETRRSR